MLQFLFPPDEFSDWWPYALTGITIAIIFIIAIHGSVREKNSSPE